MKDEEVIELERKKLLEQLEKPLIDENSENYTSHEINWIDNAPTWDHVKQLANDFLKREERMVFLSHYRDTIKGKPQLIHQTIQRIPVVRKIMKKITKKGQEDFGIFIKFLGDRYDKRYDGNEIDNVCFDFWVYRLIDNGKEYYLLSQNKLSEEYSELTGMKIDIDDMSGLSDTLKLNKIASIFLVKEFKPAVKIIAKEILPEFTKERWNEESFKDYIFSHPDGNIYEYTKEFNLLRISQLLSAKYEGYPLHLMKMGPVGTGKTTEAEAIDFKFKEELGILEAGTSRMKVLVPSFKEKPANLGYICNCNRVAIIDELMKMVASATQNAHVDVNNYFGELNMLLEHKKRLVGSGNDNSTIVKTTAKVCITTNPLPKKPYISSHLSILDNSTLSRMLIWVQDVEETEKIYKKEGIRSINGLYEPKSREYSPNPEESFSLCKIFENPIKSCDCVLGNYFDFLTVYDSCQQFLVNYDLDKVKEIFTKSNNLTKDGMKQIWKARGLHHSVLILDGITKFRCLFKDFTADYTAKEEDYQNLELIITKMIKGWDTNLENQGFGGF